MLNLPRIIAGLALSTLIGWLAYRRQSLSGSGWLGAIITGTLTFGFGGWAWGGTLIAFFISSSALSHVRQREKQQITGEKFAKSGRRDIWQALANGGPGALLALVYGLAGEPSALLACFCGIIATTTADTWATELGVLSPSLPRLITSWRVVEPGTSGGVSAYGLAASLAGGLFIGVVAATLSLAERGIWLPTLALAGTLGGLAGSLADSLLGATRQAIYHTPGGSETERSNGAAGANQLVRGWRWMTNDAVNLCSSLVGGAVALAYVLVVHSV